MKIDWNREWYSTPEYAVTCPFCNAKPGYRCRTTNGSDQVYPSYTHPVRQAVFTAVTTGHQIGLKEAREAAAVKAADAAWAVDQDVALQRCSCWPPNVTPSSILKPRSCSRTRRERAGRTTQPGPQGGPAGHPADGGRRLGLPGLHRPAPDRPTSGRLDDVHLGRSGQPAGRVQRQPPLPTLAEPERDHRMSRHARRLALAELRTKGSCSAPPRPQPASATTRTRSAPRRADNGGHEPGRYGRLRRPVRASTPRSTDWSPAGPAHERRGRPHFAAEAADQVGEPLLPEPVHRPLGRPRHLVGADLAGRRDHHRRRGRGDGDRPVHQLDRRSPMATTRTPKEAPVHRRDPRWRRLQRRRRDHRDSAGRTRSTSPSAVPPRCSFHRWQSDAVDAKAAAAKGSRAKKTDNVESYVWRNENNVICLPGEYVRGRWPARTGQPSTARTRGPHASSALDLMKAAVVPLTDLAPITRVTGDKATTWDYLDRRRVTVQRAGITRERPAFLAGWEAALTLQCCCRSTVAGLPARRARRRRAAGRGRRLPADVRAVLDHPLSAV